jgi:hypothetical protein
MPRIYVNVHKHPIVAIPLLGVEYCACMDITHNPNKKINKQIKTQISRPFIPPLNYDHICQLFGRRDKYPISEITSLNPSFAEFKSIIGLVLSDSRVQEISEKGNDEGNC